jgi:GH15 family glucan-1,4-alpha-glucosidase
MREGTGLKVMKRIAVVLVLVFGLSSMRAYGQMKPSEMLDIVHMPIQQSAPDLPAPLHSLTGPKTPLVTGNGYGFAVVSLKGQVTKLYAHPYRFEHPNLDITKDGDDTANLIHDLGWSAPGSSATETHYRVESNIISAKSWEAERLYFMPFGVSRNVLVTAYRTIVPSEGSYDSLTHMWVGWSHRCTEQRIIDADDRQVRWYGFAGIKESVAIVPLDRRSISERDQKLQVDSARTLADEKGRAKSVHVYSMQDDGPVDRAYAFVVLNNPDELTDAVKDVMRWQAGLKPTELVDRELKELESWRVKPPVHFASADERSLWRQSETFLRMAQIREPNTDKRFSSGLILASLPDGVWFTPWVRDMSYSAIALIRTGHLDEARKALLAYMNARPVGLWKKETRNLDYQISVVRYFGDGSEEADYSGCKTENIEFDDWGLALWTMADYLDKTHDLDFFKTATYRGTVYESMRDYIVRPLLGNLDPYGKGMIVAQDSSLWEEHQENKRHYACSTIAAINGLRGFYGLADAMHDYPTLHMLAPKLKQLEAGFRSAFVKDGVLRGTIEASFKNEIDGCLVEGFNWGVEKDPSVREKTLKKLDLLKTASGGYRRVRGKTQYETHEFLFIDFCLARLYYKLGLKDMGNRLIEPITRKSCQDNGLIPEMYVSEKNSEFPGDIGDPTGATPMVGYGAGAYIMTLIARENAGSIAH